MTEKQLILYRMQVKKLKKKKKLTRYSYEELHEYNSETNSSGYDRQ